MFFFNARSRFTAYTANRDKINFSRELITVNFIDSEINMPKSGDKLEAGIPPGVAVAIVEQGGKVIYDLVLHQLSKRLESFVHRYFVRATNIKAGSFRLPHIKFDASLEQGGKNKPGLRIRLTPVLLRGTNSYVYQLERIDLQHARARASRLSSVYDYKIQPTFYFLKGDTLYEKELPPLIVNSLRFGENDLREQQLYTSVIPFVEDACLVEVALTIVESNPAKVNTATILSAVEDHETEILKKLQSLLEGLFKKPSNKSS